MLYYYFLSCNGEICYQTLQTDWDTAFSATSPTQGVVYLIENITDLPYGCYTAIKEESCVSGTIFSGYQITSSVTIASGCTDGICSPTPTPTPSITPTISVTPSITPTISVTPSITPTISVTPSITPTISVTPSITPTPGGCFSATTIGTYFYTDCCGVEYEGTSIGDIVCVDTLYPYDGLFITNTFCIQNCDQGPLNYIFSVTGVCENLGQGVIEITPIGGIKPYTLQNTSPGGLSAQTGNGPFYWSNLSSGTYVFRLNDSSGGVNQDLFINVIVDGCFCADIDNVSGTICGDDTTGEFNVNGSSNSLPYSIELYRNGVLNQTVSSPSQTYSFGNLTSGIYYAFVTDFGGATAQTESVVVEESVGLDFGLFTISESPCIGGNGSATVTGLTGTAPYTYLWSDGQTTQTATGLTEGDYSVTVTDSLGCVKFNEFTIVLSQNIGVASVIPTQANCFSCDGQLLVTITGGTAPYTYVGSNGQTLTTQSQSFLMSNLCSGAHSVIVTDAGSCQTTALGSVSSTAGFSVVSINVTNSTCSDDGSIQINLDALQGIFTYTLTDENNSSQSITTSNQTYTFSNLSSGDYDIQIDYNGGVCTYTTQKTVTNVNKFNVVTDITGATCGGRNGQIQVFVSEGVQTLKYPFDYILTDVNLQQVVYSQIDVNDIQPIINGLASGTYSLTVTDNENCTVSQTLSIGQTSGVDFSLSKTDCVLGDDGTATVTIFNGEPPFTYTWSSNLPSGESGGSVGNLPGGTYTVTVTDSNDCSDTKSITINCDNNRVTCYELNSICEQDFITTSGNKRGFEEMLNEAFVDLTSGYTNCVLLESIFYANIGITGSTGVILNTSQSFYTGTTLTDYPEDSDWIDIINTILSTVTEIDSFTLNTDNNQLTIISDCDGDEDPLRGAQFSLSSKVELEIRCDSLCDTSNGIGMYLTIDTGTPPPGGLGVLTPLVRMEYQGDDGFGKPTYGYTIFSGGTTLMNYDYGLSKWEFVLSADTSDVYYSDTLVSSSWSGTPSPDFPGVSATTCGYPDLSEYCIETDGTLFQLLPTWTQTQTTTEVPTIWTAFVLNFIWGPILGAPDGWYISTDTDEGFVSGGTINELPLGEITLNSGSTVTVYEGACDTIPTPTPTITVTPSVTPTVTPSITPTISVTPTPSVTPSITPSATPILQASFLFDGINEYVQVADADDLSFGSGGTDQAFTLSSWVYLNSYVNNNAIFNKNNEYRLRITATGFMFFDLLTNSSNRLGRSCALSLSNWLHIVCTYDGSKVNTGMKIYINGVEQATGGGNAGTYTGMNNGSGTLNFMGYSTYYIDGNANHFSVIAKELSAAEVTELYNGGLPIDISTASFYSDIVSHWAMDKRDDPTTIVNDIVGTNNGTPFNMSAANLDEVNYPT